LLLLLRSLDETTEKSSRSMEPRSDGSDRTSHDLRYLLVTIFLDIRKDDDLALIG